MGNHVLCHLLISPLTLVLNLILSIYFLQREFKELNMMLFPEVLERIAQYDRVLSNRGGSLLLCGSR